MKDREPKPGAFRAFAAIFTRNWGLKLLALALSILIYYTLKPTPSGGGERRRADTAVATVIEQVANPTPRADAKAPDSK